MSRNAGTQPPGVRLHRVQTLTDAALCIIAALKREHPDLYAGFLTKTLFGALPPGSYVFIHHLLDSGDPAVADVQAALLDGLGRGQFRTRAQIRSLFDGLDLVPPGLVLVPEWRPAEGTPSADDFPVLRLACAGVARKP